MSQNLKNIKSCCWSSDVILVKHEVRRLVQSDLSLPPIGRALVLKGAEIEPCPILANNDDIVVSTQVCSASSIHAIKHEFSSVGS